MESKYIIVFGAGASFGSDDPRSARLPAMGGSLFTELAARFPGSWGALPDRFASSFAADFEAGMDAYISHAESGRHGAMMGGRGCSAVSPTLNRLQTDLGRYFVEFFPAPQTSTDGLSRGPLPLPEGGRVRLSR